MGEPRSLRPCLRPQLQIREPAEDRHAEKGPHAATRDENSGIYSLRDQQGIQRRLRVTRRDVTPPNLNTAHPNTHHPNPTHTTHPTPPHTNTPTFFSVQTQTLKAWNPLAELNTNSQVSSCFDDALLVRTMMNSTSVIHGSVIINQSTCWGGGGCALCLQR